MEDEGTEGDSLVFVLYLKITRSDCTCMEEEIKGGVGKENKYKGVLAIF